MPTPRIGTVDLPERVDRPRYFRELNYLELSALFPGPLKPSALARWAAESPKQSIGLVAPWVLTHRKAPKSTKLWDHDASVGDFRDSAPGRAALAGLVEAVAALNAPCVVFSSPPLFAPSAANRELLKRFFGEIATPDVINAERVWVPDGLWEPRSAVTFANELGVTCALDPLVREPGQPPEIYEDLDAQSVYFRVSGLGRSGTIRTEQLEELALLVDHYSESSVTIAFNSPSRWQDARNLTKSLEATLGVDD
ncbi:MAG: DUF72 domain-containing protein [Kofleriaceae bacterium]